jgi:hypothetical protein
MSSEPQNIVQALCAVAPKSNTSQPLINGPKGAPTLENSEGTMPRQSLRPRRGKAGDLGSFSLKLTDEEITDDIFSMTGELPREHPHQRPVQTQMMVNVSRCPSPRFPLADFIPPLYWLLLFLLSLVN